MSNGSTEGGPPRLQGSAPPESQLPDALPTVSVIVPVRNQVSRIGRCLDALLAQTYPRSRVEIVVVDNDSDDGTPERVQRYPVTLLFEREVRSPYAARNRGIEQARGHVLAFTDGDCAPDKDWLARALQRMSREGADLVAGRVRFSHSHRPRAAELLDSLNNLDQERSVAERGVAKTGNLLARRRVFRQIGGFAGERRSGGDVDWTGRATGAGFALVYEPDAVVEKPARRFAALARKQLRVGRGQYFLWRARGDGPARILWKSLRAFRPGRPSAVRESLRCRGPAGSESRAVAVWFLGWVCAMITAIGRLYELARAGGWR